MATNARHPTMMAVVVAVLILVVLSPALVRPAFGPVDDHELLSISNQVSVDGWLPTLAAHANEEAARFRPAYWVGFLLERMRVWSVDGGNGFEPYDPNVLAVRVRPS